MTDRFLTNNTAKEIMREDLNVIWNNCLKTIRKHVETQSFKTWFLPISPIKLQDEILTIKVPNKFFYEWLEEHYVDLIKMAIHQEISSSTKLEYQIPVVRANSSKQSINLEESGPALVAANEIKNPFVIPGIKKLKIDPNLNSENIFDNFIEGDCNKLARSAGMAVANKPGGTAFNPLFIFGDSGLGKTHLAQAIGNTVIDKYPGKSVLYVSCEKFTSQFIDSLRKNATSDFVTFYQMVDVLIVDDIQFLSNKLKTQEIFFSIFNQIHQSGKQLVLTCDRPPKDLKGIEDRLISRFKWGLQADVQEPDFETKIAILEAKMMDEGLELPNDVIEFICYNVKNNIRELEGALISLIAQSSLNQKKIDLELAKEVIRNIVDELSNEITIEFIQELVADHFDVQVGHLQGKTRKRKIVIARQLSMYLAKKLTNKSLKAIGANFGGRDHSTVIYSCKAVSDMLDTDKVFKGTVADLEKKIQLSLHD